MPWRYNPFTGNLDETDIPAFNGEVTLGSAASPSIFFTGDPNTGIYSPGADQVAISTAGSQRLLIDASGNVTLDNATGDAELTVRSSFTAGTDADAQLTLDANTGGESDIRFASGGVIGGDIQYRHSTDELVIASPNSVDLHTGGGSSLLITADGDAELYGKLGVAGTTAGSAAAPSVYFGSDTNTGLYSPGADQLALSTNGTGRLFIGSDGVISIGAAPVLGGNEFTVSSADTTTIDIVGGTSNLSRLFFSDTTTARGYVNYDHSDDSFRFGTAANEKLRITSTGTVNIVGAGTAGSTQAVSFNGSAPVNSLVLTSAGLVGIGTSVPRGNFEISTPISYGGSANQSIYIGASNVGNGVNNDRTLAWKFHVAGDQNGQNLTLYSVDDVGATNGENPRVTFTRTGVGIGTTSPGAALHVVTSGAGRIRHADGTRAIEMGSTGTVSYIGSITAGQDLALYAANGEKARIDSSGRLLVGTSSTSIASTAILQGRSDNATEGAVLRLARGLNNPADGSSLSALSFTDSGHTNAALIAAVRDGGTWTSGTSQPTRLVFSVTADGASSPTEAMRIKNSRILNFANTPVYADNAAAKTGGLVDGDVYRKSDGTLMIVYT